MPLDASTPQLAVRLFTIRVPHTSFVAHCAVLQVQTGQPMSTNVSISTGLALSVAGPLVSGAKQPRGAYARPMAATTLSRGGGTAACGSAWQKLAELPLAVTEAA